MLDMLKMVIVLTILSAFSGGLLAAVRNGTTERIENQQLAFVKGPAILSILEGASNDPIADRFKLPDGEMERSFFVGVMDGKPHTVAFETFGPGYGGDIGLMVAVDLDTDKIIGVGVTTHAETPGIGSKAKTDPSFSGQFAGMELKGDFKVKNDGGQVDVLSGATVTSRGVAAAVADAVGVYGQMKPQIVEKTQTFK